MRGRRLRQLIASKKSVMRHFVVGERGPLPLFLTSVGAEHNGLARIFAVAVRSRHRRRLIVVNDRADRTVRSELGEQNNKEEARNEPGPPCSVAAQVHKTEYTA